MKSNKKRIFIVGIFIGIILFNFALTFYTNPNQENFSLKNIKALSVSAGEVYCDQCDQSICVIRIGDVRGESTGTVRGSS